MRERKIICRSRKLLYIEKSLILVNGLEENMKKIICICDHCGTEFNPVNGYSDLEVDDFDFAKL